MTKREQAQGNMKLRRDRSKMQMQPLIEVPKRTDAVGKPRRRTTRASIDGLRTFLAEHCKFEAEATIPAPDLLAQYHDYCSVHSIHPVPDRFRQNVLAYLGCRYRRPKGSIGRWLGISFR